MYEEQSHFSSYLNRRHKRAKIRASVILRACIERVCAAMDTSVLYMNAKTLKGETC